MAMLNNQRVDHTEGVLIQKITRKNTSQSGSSPQIRNNKNIFEITNQRLIGYLVRSSYQVGVGKSPLYCWNYQAIPSGKHTKSY